MADIVITSIDRKILEALQQEKDSPANIDNGWLSRRQIAERLGGKKLQNHHISELERLVYFGYIERDDRIIGVSQPVFYYRFLKGAK